MHSPPEIQENSISPLALSRTGGGSELTPDHHPCEEEPLAPPVLGAMEFGAGRIAFIGDLNGLEEVPQPFTDNYLSWLLPEGFGEEGVELSILVDASRGGGAWWFPQYPVFDPDEPHQGKALADYFRSLGLVVEELPRNPFLTIDSDLLSSFEMVIVTTWSNGYSETESQAYKEFVSAGGGLFLVGGHTRTQSTGNTLSPVFGILFQGTNMPTHTTVSRFEAHPLTAAVTSIPFIAGSGLVAVPETATLLGWLPEDVYLDIDNDERRQTCEHAADEEVKESGLSILVDATNDGGVWWFPQAGPFDPDEPHQGKPLADYFRSLGHAVEELPRVPRPAINLDLLSDFDLVLVASFRGYSSAEMEVYREFVESGGGLLITSEHRGSTFSTHFGVAFQGVNDPPITSVNRFAPHPLTDGVTSLPFIAGSGLVEPPPEDATLLGWLPEDVFLDLDRDGVRDEEEPWGPPVLGTRELGAGRIVFFGDLNGLEVVPQPFTDNYLEWLLAGAQEPDGEEDSGEHEEDRDVEVELDYGDVEVTISLESRGPEQGDRVILNFQAGRGEMKVSFQKSGTEREEVEMRIAFHELIEFKDLDEDGAFDLLDDRVIQQVPIEALTVDRLGTAPLEVGGLEGQQITVNYSFPGTQGGNVSLIFSVLGQAAIIDGVPVRPAEAKVDVRVEDFPFVEAGSALAVDVVIRTAFEVRAEVTLDQVIAQGEEFATFFRWSSEATVDGRTVPVEATIFSQRLEAEVEGNAGAFENRTRIFFAYPRGAKIVHGATVGKMTVASLPLAGPSYLALGVGVGTALLLVLGGRSLMRRRR